MKIKPVTMWRKLEEVYEQKIIKQAQNFSIDSDYYDKELLKRNIVMLKAVKQLQAQVIKYNLKNQ